jgi:predicted membrane channel-forming protein YqfA (hemolysin III family)
MTIAKPETQYSQTEYYPKRNWRHWLAAVLILVCIPVNFLISSINPMQAELEECNLQRELRQIPNSGAPATSLDDFYRCTKAGSKASTYFFLTSLMILFNVSGIDGVITMKRRGAVAYTAGLIYVTAVSFILGAGIPLAFLTLNLPIVAFLWLMWKKKYLTA